MKKGLIFIGKAESGKSRTAQQIRNYYGDSAVYLDGRQFKMSNNFLLGSCTEATKVVIIDELHPKFPLEYFYNILTGKLLVNKKNRMPFEIEIDKLIIILDSDKKVTDLPQGGSFQRRFTVVEFPNASPEFVIDELIVESSENRTGKSLLLDGLSFLREVSTTDR